jgi:integrase
MRCSPQAILHAWRRRKLKTRRKLAAPYDHLNRTSIWKIAELEEVFSFRFPKDMPQHAEVDPYAYALLFVIYTAVRPDMACGLLWSEVKWERGYIDFGKRHKMAERDPEAEYTIPITPEVRALLDKQKELQHRDGIDDALHVFVHGRKRIGSSYYYRRHLVAHQLNQYLKRVLVLLDLVDGETNPKKMPSAHGFRNTFPEWASDLSEADKYHLEYIEAQLGHKIKVNNRMYYRNVTYIRRRGGMMTDWEKYCTRLRSAPVTPANIVELKRARSK